MTETITRRPAAFRLEDPSIVVTLEPDAAVLPAAPDMLAPLPKRPWPWGKLFWGAAGGLVLLALGLGTVNLVEDLFARAAWLGVAGLGLAALAGVALIAIVTREVTGLMRLTVIEGLRERAIAVLASDDRSAARALLKELLSLTRRTPQLASARARLQGHLEGIIDGRDLLQIAERELMAPLDTEARRLVAASAQRVSIVTAVSPRAAVDMLFVFVSALGMVRRLAVLYGGRPGMLGLIRLMREVIAHLAMTGGMAASDSLIQQVIGHGLAAKVSARLGEGMLNGLLTARLGLAAIEVTRPLPFSTLRRPSLNDLVGAMLRTAEKQKDALSAAPNPDEAKVSEGRPVA